MIYKNNYTQHVHAGNSSLSVTEILLKYFLILFYFLLFESNDQQKKLLK